MSRHKADKKPTDEAEKLSERVLKWVRETTGWWATSELDSDLGIVDKKSKENRQQILLRLRLAGVVEQHQRINKQFRFINTQVTSLEFKTATNAGVLPIKWPLGIEKLVNFYPGNMAVIAGAPNAGKTAFMLETIYLNQDLFPTYYLCSEMGAVELRSRLDMFPGMAIEDWHFKAFERVSDFADVIVPDAFNIIDYLEMTTDLFAVNTYLTAINHRVGSGLALVAIQKKVGKQWQFGRGQEFGLEKPKLYLSLDRGELTIVKGKSWANKNGDPNGLQRKFKISLGCKFEAIGDWERPQ